MGKFGKFVIASGFLRRVRKVRINRHCEILKKPKQSITHAVRFLKCKFTPKNATLSRVATLTMTNDKRFLK